MSSDGHDHEPEVSAAMPRRAKMWSRGVTCLMVEFMEKQRFQGPSLTRVEDQVEVFEAEARQGSRRWALRQ